MVVVRGAFNHLLRPGLMKIWKEAFGLVKRRTGVEEVELGRPPRRRLEDIPHAEDEWAPKGLAVTTVKLTMKDDSSLLVLKDGSGNVMHVGRDGNFLQFVLECDVGVTSFNASATQVGKIFELVVDQFFPKGGGDDGGTEDQQHIRPE